MTPADRTAFAKLMALLSQTFNESLSEMRLEAYWIALGDCELSDLEPATYQAMRTCKFFPRPVEIRELLDGSREDDAEKAWQEYKSLARRVGGYRTPQLDAALAETLTIVFGNWEAACWADYSPEMWASKRKEFGRTYRIVRQRGVKGPAQLPGFFEREGQLAIEHGVSTKQLTDGGDESC